jgi:hypothetical protein
VQEKAIEQARNEAFLKIGRNVVNFQKLEGLLKALVKSSWFQGKASEIEALVKKRNASIDMQSMGMLVGSLFENVLVQPPQEEVSETADPEDSSEPWMSFKFVIELEKQASQELERAFSDIVEERNRLIHQLLATTDFHSVESCDQLCSQLDEQSEKLKPKFEMLQSFLRSKVAMQSQVANHIQSEIIQNDT